MNCPESRDAIEQLRPFSVPAGALKAHLDNCELCQHYYGERELERELAMLQVPEPSQAFLAKAMQHAVVEGEARRTASQPARWRWPSAIAASALVAVVGIFAMQDRSVTSESDQDFATVSSADKPYREEVRILIRSQEDWEQAEVFVELAEDLELEGFAGERSVSWHTKLSKGTNMLTLPILVRSQGGDVRIRSYYGETSHEVQVRVAPKDKSTGVFGIRQNAAA